MKKSNFRWLAGEDLTMSYESSPGNNRAFCYTCGSVAPVVTAYGAVRVPAAALDEDPGVGPTVIIFDRSKGALMGGKISMAVDCDVEVRPMYSSETFDPA